MHNELVCEIKNKPIGIYLKKITNGKVSEFKHFTTHLKGFPHKKHELLHQAVVSKHKQFTTNFERFFLNLKCLKGL